MELLSFGKINQTEIRRIRSAQGNWIQDAEGKKYFDSMSGLWCVPLGYSQDPIKQAITLQAAQLPFYHNFFHTQSEISFELTQQLEKIFPKNPRIYYSCSGSAANETALKIVFRYFDKKNLPKKKGVIYLQHSYHGTSFCAQQVSDQSMSKFTDVHLTFPTYRCDVNPEDSSETLKNMQALLEKHADEIGAVIVEPVIGAGGVIPFNESFFATLRTLTLDKNVKLIVDEVVTGFGKLGTLFAAQKWNIKADIFTAGKAMTNGYMPLAATFASNEMIEETIKWFNHGYTFSSHPLAAAASIATLKVLNGVLPELNFDELHKKLDSLEHPDLLKVRKVSNMGALVFKDGFSCGQIEALGWQEGIILRSGSGQSNVLCFCLPLVTTPSEIDFFIEKLQNCLDRLG